MKVSVLKDERGAALITGLLFVLVLTILSIAAMMSTATELKIVANDRSSKQVFYAAEAGLEDARSRLQTGASASPITDSPANPLWKAFVGLDTKSELKGYDRGSSHHTLYARLDGSLDYVTRVEYKLDGSGNILKWGDTDGNGVSEENTTVGNNIFVITSEGYASNGAVKPVKIEAVRTPSISAPAALYTKERTTIAGASVSVLGMDHCGSDPVAGVITRDALTQAGGPTINGSPAVEEYSSTNIDVQHIIDAFKGKATYSYNVNSLTLTGMNWGTPVLGATPRDATNCSTRNIVYFNTNSTYVKLQAFTQGCGMLLVEGDLAVHGGFEWYGVIVVTGSITFTGGGEKNVTGAMLAGGTTSADLVGGDASIVYCSRAVRDQTDYLPLITLRWLELFS
jgi:Tfp pilus assembly protein PilX